MVDNLPQEMNQWIQENDIKPASRPFLRYHIIDMRGEMDITYGILRKTPRGTEAPPRR